MSCLLALAVCGASTAWAVAPASGEVALAPAAVASAPAAIASPTFDVMNYVVEGNSLLSDEAVENAVTPYLGPDRTFKDIEAARAALEKAYQDAGFLSVVVSLPPQRVDGGDIRLQVVEAPVEKLRVTGAQYHLPSKLRQALPSLAAGQTPSFPQVQRELSAAQSADVQLTPLISPGKTPNTIDVEVKVDDKPGVHGSLEANSRQSFNTLRGRTEAVLGYDNLFQLGQSINLSWQYAPRRPSDANTLSVLYGIPLDAKDDLTLSVTHSNSNTPTGTSLGGATLTRGTFAGVRWQHTLPTLGWPVDHYAFAALNYKDNKDASVDVGGLTTQNPTLRYPTIALGYGLRWYGDKGTLTGFNTSVEGSTGGLSSRQIDCNGVHEDQFACKRAGATPDFLEWKFGLTHQRSLFDWLGEWQLNAQLNAQLASGPLTSAEQYSIGGIDTVRGYYDYEQAGDDGWNTRLELVTPAWLKAWDWRSTFLLFWDRGAVHTQEALSGQLARVQLGSYGLGWRAAGAHGVEIAWDLAVPVFSTTKAASDGSQTTATRRHDVRWELSARYAF